jgi:hypothetical protein
MKKHSKLIANININTLNKVIILSDISKQILYKVIKYCNHHSNKSSKFKKIYSKENTIYNDLIDTSWDIHFIKQLSYDKTKELLYASTFLQIDSLIYLSTIHLTILSKVNHLAELLVKYDCIIKSNDVNDISDYIIVENAKNSCILS